MSAWLGPALRLHNRLAAGLVALSCLAAASPPGVPAQAAVLLAGVVLVGMPHGAFDHLVARRALRPRLGRAWWGPFLLAYVALAALVCLGWALAPEVTLAAFLALSVLHFGLGDTEERPGSRGRFVAVLARGGLPVLLPIALHPAAAAPVLALLAGTSAAAMEAALATWATRLLLPWGLALVLWAWRGGATGRERLEAAALCAAFVLLPPLLAFALYFCACHSVRHLLRLGAMLAPDSAREAWQRVWRVGLPAALACALGAAALAAQGTEAALAPLFRLLAALTLPHMAVTLWLEEQA